MNALTREFLDWIDSRERTYAEAMEAWRSNCPRHPVWEDALADGLVEVENGSTLDGSKVSLTARGKAALAGERARKPTAG